MKIKLNNFFTSGWTFEKSEDNLKSRYQMVNVGILLSSLGLIFGIIGNIIRDIPGFVPFETFLVCMNITLFFILRKYRNAFEYVSVTITTLFTFLFLFLVYMSEPSSLKHVWLFTYPIIILYFQKKHAGVYWLTITIFALMIAPIQGFIEVKYSLYQVTYLSFVLLIVSTIIYFYQVKMDEAKALILEQQNQLLDFNAQLEKQVKEKTTELRELNESLEIKVQDKIEELIQKDKILTLQSKQAVMGEMISMIAHQWRQPLSTITLQISNLQFKKMLGGDVNEQDINNTLTEISDTIIYLSDTIDDFQTYFHPDKESVEIELHELLSRAVNFALPRVKENGIEIELKKDGDINIQTYINELIQVVLNILNNAIDALNEVSDIKNKLSITITTEEKNENIIIYIKDNATGIKEEHIKQLFEPYFSTKGKNGTGLGLYMSQMIVQKQFNGEINVETSADGATFIVEIPKYIS